MIEIMEKTEIKDKLKDILANYVEIDENSFDENTNLMNDTGIDSFSLICMVGDIERTFKIKMEVTQLSQIHTFGDMINFISSKI